jgi:hypothetical protein
VNLRFFCIGQGGDRAFARMPTHAMRLHEWGTRDIGWVYVWATRHPRYGLGFMYGPPAPHIISKSMTYISWTTYRCPSCRAQLDRHAGGNFGIRLGPEFAKCKCGQVLSTRCREWINLNKTERRKYLLPGYDALVVSLFLIFSLIIRMPIDLHIWIALSIIGLYALVPLSKLLAIRDSQKRCQERSQG